jgi:hypothetical protein
MVKMSKKAAEKLSDLKENNYEDYVKFQENKSKNVSKGLLKF